MPCPCRDSNPNTLVVEPVVRRYIDRAIAALGSGRPNICLEGTRRGTKNFSHDMMSSIFWDITPCSPMKVDRRFGGTCRSHFHGRRVNQELSQQEAGRNRVLFAAHFMLFSRLAYYSTLETEATCSTETSADFHRTTQKALIAIAVRISNSP
jgi:hypothetical protein